MSQFEMSDDELEIMLKQYIAEHERKHGKKLSQDVVDSYRKSAKFSVQMYRLAQASGLSLMELHSCCQNIESYCEMKLVVIAMSRPLDSLGDLKD